VFIVVVVVVAIANDVVNVGNIMDL